MEHPLIVLILYFYQVWDYLLLLWKEKIMLKIYILSKIDTFSFIKLQTFIYLRSYDIINKKK